MILTVLITPLQIKKKITNQANIAYSIKEGIEPPKLKEWDEVFYNARSVQVVGDTEVVVSTIEKMKSVCNYDFEVGKSVLVSVDLYPWFMEGGKGISAKILGLVKS